MTAVALSALAGIGQYIADAWAVTTILFAIVVGIGGRRRGTAPRHPARRGTWTPTDEEIAALIDAEGGKSA